MNTPTIIQCREEAAAGRVREVASPCGNFVLFNYNELLQFSGEWNEVNMWCRGIVFDVHTGAIVATPFRKFFNIGQHPESDPERLRGLRMETVAEKMDGSLGIIFWDKYAQAHKVCTRGSFVSEQSRWAHEWLLSNMSDPQRDYLRRGGTILAEIIYPENRVVVPYDFSGLALLGCDGKPHAWLSAPGWRLPKFDAFATLDDLLERAKTLPWNDEGYVATFDDGTMVKIKSLAYLQVHKLRFGLTPRAVCDALSEGRDPVAEAALVGFPDEFATDLRRMRADCESRFNDLHARICAAVSAAPRDDRKTTALWAKDNAGDLLPFFFIALDGNTDKLHSRIWATVREQLPIGIGGLNG